MSTSSEFRATLMDIADEYERMVAESHHVKEENRLMQEQLRQTRSASKDKGCSMVSLDEIAMDVEANIEPLREISLSSKGNGIDKECSDPLILDEILPADTGRQAEVFDVSVPGNGLDNDQIKLAHEASCTQDGKEFPKLVLDELQSDDSDKPSDRGSSKGYSNEPGKGKMHVKEASLGVLSRWFNPDADEGTTMGYAHSVSSDPIGLLVLGTQTVEPDCGTVWPLGRFRLTWDFIAFLCLLVELWATPFELVFLTEFDTPLSLQVVSFCITGFFGADIVLNFSTGYIEGDTTVMNRKDIIRTYLKFWFWIDLVSTIPFDLIAETVAGNMFSIARVGRVSKALKILRYLKMVRAIRLIKTMKQAGHLRRHFQILEPLRAIMQPIQVQIFLLLLAHVHGVVWAAMQPDWLAFNMSDALRNYYQSFTWAYSLMTIGSVGPSFKESEAIWTLEMLMASERMIFITLACRQVILHSLAYVDDAQKGQTHKDLLTYFRRHNVSLQTQIQVMFSLTDMRNARKQQQYYNHLDDLPVQLSRVLRLELWSDHLLSMGLIQEVASWHSEFVSELCQVATERVLPSRCVLVHEGTAAIASYYILDGELTAVMAQESTYIPQFKKGMWFGENSFVSPLLRYSATFSTAKISSLMSVRGSAFLQLVSQLGLMDHFETFCSEELWKGLCGRCGSLGDHFSDKCPYSYGPQLWEADFATAETDASPAVGSSLSLRKSDLPTPRKRSNSITSTGTIGSITSRLSRQSSALGGANLGDLQPHQNIGRGLRRLLQELDLERLIPFLIQMDMKDLDDLGRLDLAGLNLLLPAEQRLSPFQLQGLEPEYVQNFREKSARRVRNTLFRAVSRLHHLMFLSHYKLEAGTEAALMRTELEHAIADDMGSPGHYFDDPVFLDSDNLQNLTDLQQRVVNSHNLVLLLTKGVLSRPWCLVEIVTAKREGVRVIPVNVSKPGEVFTYPDEKFYDRLRSGGYLDPTATETLESCNCSLTDVEDAIRSVFHHIALPYSPHKGRNIRKAEIDALLKQCRLKDEADESRAVALMVSERNDGAGTPQTLSTPSPRRFHTPDAPRSPRGGRRSSAKDWEFEMQM